MWNTCTPQRVSPQPPTPSEHDFRPPPPPFRFVPHRVTPRLSLPLPPPKSYGLPGPPPAVDLSGKVLFRPLAKGRAFMHRSGAVFVRVAPRGLVLLPNVHWRDTEEVRTYTFHVFCICEGIAIHRFAYQQRETVPTGWVARCLFSGAVAVSSCCCCSLALLLFAGVVVWTSSVPGSPSLLALV